MTEEKLNILEDVAKTVEVDAVLELIEELRQVKRERNWLVVQVVECKTYCPMNREWEKCDDGQYENKNEPKNNQRCIKCWLQAAKEATCLQI